ncbi:Uncharacterised protein [Paenibacillus thiaminolyticus]|nr:Uncharacterised protein [Paenibacillus thiaminolyticus]
MISFLHSTSFIVSFIFCLTFISLLEKLKNNQNIIIYKLICSLTFSILIYSLFSIILLKS